MTGGQVDAAAIPRDDEATGEDEVEVTGAGRAPTGASLGLLPEFLGYLLRRAQVWAYDDFARTVGDLDISPGQWGLLALIQANPGLTQIELAEAVGLNKSTLTPALRRLETRRLIDRRPRRSDRRFNRIRLSDEGTALFGELLLRVRAHDRALSNRLTGEERALLVGLLGKMMGVDAAGWSAPKEGEP